MPEGDTIWRTAAALRRRIEGKVVTEARPDRIRRLEGRHVIGVEPTGKHLIMRFDGDIALHSHMRMTGAWHLYRPGERWRQPAHRMKAMLAFDDVVGCRGLTTDCAVATKATSGGPKQRASGSSTSIPARSASAPASPWSRATRCMDVRKAMAQ